MAGPGHGADVTLAEALARNARERGDALAFRFLARHAVNHRDLTWGQLDAAAREVAGGLAARGLAGKPVAIICTDRRDFVLALAASFVAGAVTVPVPAVATRRSAERIRSILDVAKPRAILAPAAILDQPWIAELVRPGEIDGLVLEEMAGAGRPPVSPTIASPALLQFTSGSTGTPRGIRLSHANIAANCAAIAEAYQLDGDTRAFSWLPLHHDMGLVGHVLATFWYGGTSILMDPLLFLQSPLRWLRQIGDEKATITSAPNFAYDLCARDAALHGTEGIDLSSLRTAICGGEMVWPETVARFSAAFGPCGFDPGAFAPSYGLAETTLLVSTGKRRGGPGFFTGAVAGQTGKSAATVATSQGKPVRDTLVRILSEDGMPLPDETLGEIEVRGPGVGEPLGGDRPATAGAVLTGDIGFLSGGELYVTGRQKEVIIVRGQNVYPSDIEAAALAADPAVRPGGVAAVGVIEGGTESLVLLMEIDRRRPDVEELARIGRTVSEAVARATGHTPRQIVALAVGTLPRTTSGKIQRRLAAERFGRGELKSLAEPAGVAEHA